MKIRDQAITDAAEIIWIRTRVVAEGDLRRSAEIWRTAALKYAAMSMIFIGERGCQDVHATLIWLRDSAYAMAEYQKRAPSSSISEITLCDRLYRVPAREKSSA